MRTRTAIVSFVLGLLSVISLTAVAEVEEGGGGPAIGAGCETTTEVLDKEVSPGDLRLPATPKGGRGGHIEGTR